MQNLATHVHVPRHAICIMHADPVIHAGLQTLLGHSLDWVLAPSGFSEIKPSLVLADYETAMEFAPSQIKDTPFLVITNDDREWQAHAALSAGIRGYLLQSCAVDELIHAVRQVLEGRVYLSKALNEQMASNFTRIMLTRREVDVLRLLGEGNCNKLIARELGIGLGTVKTHVKSVMTKLGARARTEAVVLASKYGMLTFEHVARNRLPS